MTTTSDKDAIAQVISTYLDGLYEGDADKIARVFHKTSALTTIADDGLTITPRDQWLLDEDGGTLGALQRILAPAFDFQRVIDLPFLIREHRRKYQWSISEASLWVRK